MSFSIFMNIFSVLILIFAMLLFTVNRSWSSRELKRVENKKKEIENILESADQMIQELNNFSDYIINYIGDKMHEVDDMIADVDAEINERKIIISQQNNMFKEAGNKLEHTRNQLEKGDQKAVIPFVNKISADNINKMHTYSNNNLFSVRTTENFMNASLKSGQIIALAEKGLDEAQIAKKLNIGRGEIQLILGMKNGTTS